MAGFCRCGATDLPGNRLFAWQSGSESTPSLGLGLLGLVQAIHTCHQISLPRPETAISPLMGVAG